MVKSSTRKITTLEIYWPIPFSMHLPLEEYFYITSWDNIPGHDFRQRESDIGYSIMADVEQTLKQVLGKKIRR